MKKWRLEKYLARFMYGTLKILDCINFGWLNFRTLYFSENFTVRNFSELLYLKKKKGMPRMTRVTCETATLIDHIAMTCPINISKSGLLRLELSDHFMVYCIRKLNGSINKKHKSIKRRNMKKFSEETFLRDIASIDWEQALGFFGDANLLVQQFSNVFSQVTEKHAPRINSDLNNLIRTRDRL